MKSPIFFAVDLLNTRIASGVSCNLTVLFREKGSASGGIVAQVCETVDLVICRGERSDKARPLKVRLPQFAHGGLSAHSTRHLS